MSWIVRDLWSTLEKRRGEYESLLDSDRIRAYEIISRITHDVGHRHGIILLLNIPPGQHVPRINGLGHRDLSMLVQRGKEKFEDVSELDAMKIFEQLRPQSFERLKPDQEGFKARFSNGIIDCLPGGVHLWCEITPEVLEVLDWLFTNAYGLAPV